MGLSIPYPQVQKKSTEKNALGLSLEDYQGAVSTLCGGCGHDSVSFAIVQACFEYPVAPHKLVKLSGIGCSSKTPGYFVSKAHAFNAVHGRMPSVATGAYLAHRDLQYLAISGDGDSSCIGLSSFIHAIRRRLKLVYIVENNGVFGLTKGQFSATADSHSKSKKGLSPQQDAIDLTSLALQMGASFVGRSVSSDKDALVNLLKQAFAHPAFAFVEVLSPCVSFNHHAGSSKSYDQLFQSKETVEKPFKKASAALSFIEQSHENQKLPVGLLYQDPSAQDFHVYANTAKPALREVLFEDLCPGADLLKQLNEQLR